MAERGRIIAATLTVEYPDGTVLTGHFEADWAAETAALLFDESAMNDAQKEMFNPDTDDWRARPTYLEIRRSGTEIRKYDKLQHSDDPRWW